MAEGGHSNNAGHSLPPPIGPSRQLGHPGQFSGQITQDLTVPPPNIPLRLPPIMPVYPQNLPANLPSYLGKNYFVKAV